ncbi:MAG: hypothetical protein ACK4E0_14390 [Chitinophagaceae bacterium]
MAIKKRITSKDYYITPDINHMTGDIWINLPTMGLLKSPVSSGIVITPACDLANSKVETLTYLPIVGMSEYFCSRSYYPYLITKVVALSNSMQDYTAQSFLLKNFIIEIPDLDFIYEHYNSKERDKNGNILRILSGLTLIRHICDRGELSVDYDLLAKCFSQKEIQGVKREIVRNSFSSDLHFLPKDNQDSDWSAVKSHSVVLFRYPITIPIEIMDVANDSSILDWRAKMTQISKTFTISKEFSAIQPIKSLRLKEAFLSDLLTRFTALYIRIGSPDFDDATLEMLVKEL